MQIFQKENSSLPERFLQSIEGACSVLKNAGIQELVDIILFGSSATEKIKTGSDVDLCVVTLSKITNRGFRSELEELVDKFPCKVDLIFYIQEDLDSTDTFTRNMIKNGKSLLGGLADE